MNISRIKALFIRQLYLIRQNPLRFINMFFWCVLDVAVWGFITRYLNTVDGISYSIAPALLGGVVLWNFLVRSQQGVILAFFEDVWSHNFLNLFASPLKIREYVASLIFASMVTSLAALALLLVIAPLFGYNVLALGLSLSVFLLILFIFGTALGVVAAGIGLRFGSSAEWIAWTIPFILMPFSGVFYPVAALPQTIQWVSSFLPTAYAFEGMRSIILGNGFTGTNALLGIALAVVALFLSYFFLAAIYRKALKTGLIARFSAENSSG